ncbi:MAG: pyridoxal phosphate-dependent aminotransferase [Deltaproteobacteria bacterium]|nr:pyridoxal phosphate-dependent aminotransferase [Deltaproteobacteria bacterium]
MQFSDASSRLGTETAFDVLAKVTKLRSEGKNIISFSIGEPDFDTPSNIKSAGKKAIDDNFTHYGPSAGLPQLREVVAENSFALRGVRCRPEEVVVTPGAKPIIFHSILACINPGDEVIYPNPGFPIYESMINFVGGKPVPLPLLEEREFSFDTDELKKLVTPKTKMIILNSPHNPTGGMLSERDLEAIAEVAIKNNIWVVADEVYHRFVFQGKFASIASIPGMRDRTIIIDGCSKTYAMTGWRIGWGIMPEELAKIEARLMTNSDSCTCTFTQISAIEAQNGDQGESYRMAGEFKERAGIIHKLLNEIEGVSALMPRGAFYIFPNVTRACRKMGLMDSREFQDKLLFEAGVAVLARTCFGSRNRGETDEYVRFSFATSKDLIVKGVAIMKDYVEHYKK